MDKIRAQETVAETTESTQTATEAAGDKASANSSKGSSDSKAADANSASGTYKDGEYLGKASAYNGNVEVKVTILGGKMTAIDIVKTKDDEDYFFDAQKKVIPEILEKQSTDVDAVAGATTSSEGIAHAVQKALEQAKQ